MSDDWIKAGKDTQRRCFHCEQCVRKGQPYRRNPKMRGWEHFHCVARGGREQPALPKATAYQREVWGVHDQDKHQAAGSGANFPGTAVEWRWTEPEGWPNYRLSVAGVAYRRRLFEIAVGPEAVAAMRNVANRLLDQVVDPELLHETAREAEGEFDLPHGALPYWFAMLGVMFMGREQVADEEIRQVEVVDAALVKRILQSREY